MQDKIEKYCNVTKNTSAHTGIKKIRAICIPFLLVATVIGTSVFYANRMIRREKAQAYLASSQSAEEQLTTLAASLNGRFSTLEAYAKCLSADQTFDFQSPDTLRQLHAVRNGTYFNELTLVDAGGKAYLSDGRTYRLRDRAYFQQSMEGRRAIEKILDPRIGKKAYFVLSVPLMKEGEVIGLVAGTFSDADFRSLLDQNNDGSGGFCFVCDGDGTVIIRSALSRGIVKNSSILDVIGGEDGKRLAENMETGTSGQVTYSADGEKWYGVYMPALVDDWMIFRVVPYRVVTEPVRQTVYRTTLVSGSVALFSMLILLYTYLADRKTQKQLEGERDALHQKTRELDSLVQSTPGGIFQYSAEEDEAFAFVSDNMLRLLGYTMEEFLEVTGNRFSRMIYEEDRERVLMEIQRQIDQSDFDYCEYRITGKNGDIKWVHDVGHIVTDSRGKRWFYVVVVDITRQKEIEEALRERNAENDIVIRQSGKNIIRYEIASDTAYNVHTDPEVFAMGPEVPHFRRTMVEHGTIAGESADAFTAMMEEIRGGKPQGGGDVQVRTMDGRLRWNHADYTLVYNGEGKPDHAILSFFDNTEQREKELAYQSWRTAFSAMIADSEFYYQANLTRDVIELTEAAPEAYGTVGNAGRKMSQAVLMDCQENVYPEDARRVSEFFESGRLLALYANGVSEDHIEYRTKLRGTLCWVLASIKMVQYPDSEDVQFFSVFANVDATHKEMKRLSDLAERDAVTGLLNREATERRIREVLRTGRGPVAMFMVDVDNFKQINDTRGHQIGDRVLAGIATAISSLFRGGDVVGRIGGDEFMAFLPGGATKGLVREKAKGLVEAMQFAVADLAVTGSIGAVLCNDGNSTFEQLYAESDKALYQAKNAGKNRYSILESGMAEPRPSQEKEEEVTFVQLKSLLENMDGGVLLADVREDVRITYVSPSYNRFLRNTEVSTDNLTGILELVYPEDREKVVTAVRKTAASGKVTECAYRVGEAGGAWRHLRLAKLSENKNGSVSVIGVVTDITDMKRSEEQLRMAEERYRIALRQTGGLIWEVDIEKRTLYQAEEVSEAFGKSGTVFPNAPESVLAIDVIHPDSRREYRRMFEDIYRGAEGGSYMLFVRDGKSGYVWVRAHFGLLRSRDGSPSRAIGVSEKVTNVDADMRAFQEEVEFYDAVAPDMLGGFQVNLTGDVLEKLSLPVQGPQPAGYTAFLLEQQKSAPKGADLDRLMGATDRDGLISAYQSGRTFLMEEYRRQEGGQIRWTCFSIRLIRHPVSEDIFGFGYFYDVDERKRWELAALHGNGERDSATLLYTKASFAALAETAIQEMAPHSLCALTVVENGDFDRIRLERGAQIVQQILLHAGRLCRYTVGGSAVAGYLDEKRFMIFRADALSAEQQDNRIYRFREKMEEQLRGAFPEMRTGLYCGFAMAGKEEASFEKLLRQAEIACGTARQWPGNPVMEYADTGMETPPEAEHPKEPAKERARILLADGNGQDRAALKQLLSGEYAVSEAEDGLSALGMLLEAPFALAIIDGEIQGKSAWELLEHMGAEERLGEIPTVILVEAADAQSEIRALTMGAADVVGKPVVGKALLSRVQNMIGRQQAAAIAEKNRIYELRFQQQANLLRLAERDELTGLINRQAFYRQVRQRLNENPKKRYRILRWDLDDFKMVNDSLGVEVGDKLLKDIAEAMRERCGRDSIYARLEADHFVDFLEIAAVSPEQTMEKVFAWIAAYPINFRLSGRIGVYDIEDPSLDVSIMCDRALLALRSIKGSFTTRVAYYDDSLREKLVEEQQLTSDMVTGLKNGQFEVYYQPQYNYASGEMVGAEALVRWNHPKKGLISPGVFIPLFERNGFISAMDEYVWEESCRNIRKWLDMGSPMVPVALSVNISRMDIYNPNICGKFRELIQKYRLPVDMLKLEITESAYMENPEQLIRAVKELQAAGFRIEMDDFGAGYSSLNTLKDVPVDILKLDVRFLSQSGDKARGGNILSSVIRMAHWLKLPVIAEGVETRAQADYLKSLDCFYMQGFYFSKPLPPGEFEKLLERSSLGDTDRCKDANLEGMAAFWDASAQTALLFNSFVGGAAILEYRQGNAELVRANDAFFHTMGTTREIYAPRQTHMLDDFDRANRAVFVEMLERAAESGGEEETEVLRHGEGNREQAGRWIHARVKLLARNGGIFLIYLAVENITERKEIELQLRMSGEELQIAMAQMGKIICHYDLDTQTLTMPEAYAERYGLPHVLHNVPYGATDVTPESKEAYNAFYERILRGEKTGRAMVQFLKADGSAVWEALEFSAILGDRGESRRAIVTIEELTDKEKQPGENTAPAR